MDKTTAQQKQNSQAGLVQLDSKGNIQWISLNPNPVQLYATELWNSLSEKDTASTYKQAISKTWQLFKYLIALIVSVFLLAVALMVSFWGIGFNLGSKFQKWLDNGEQGRSPEEFAMELLKIIVLPIQKIVEWANKYVKKYLPEWNPSNCKFFESTEEKKS